MKLNSKLRKLTKQKKFSWLKCVDALAKKSGIILIKHIRLANLLPNTIGLFPASPFDVFYIKELKLLSLARLGILIKILNSIAVSVFLLVHLTGN